MFKRLALALSLIALTYVAPLSVYAIAPIERGGNAAITAGAQTIYLDGVGGTKGSYSHVIVWLDSGSSTANINFNVGQTAATTDPLLGSGSTISFGLSGFSAATNQINVYGNGTTGKVNWVAW
jgi:hypothetical protein